MSRIKRIKKILTDNFNPTHIYLLDKSKEHIGHNAFDGLNETHLYLEIKSSMFIKKNDIDIHRNINSLINDKYNDGLHAFEIKIIKD